jgi:hypothetical protein
MSSATATSNPGGDTIPHPLESFHSSMDYHHFESSIIRPSFFRPKSIILSMFIPAHLSPLLLLLAVHLLMVLLHSWLTLTITKLLLQNLFLLFLTLMYHLPKKKGILVKHIQIVLFGSMDILKKDQLYFWGVALGW